MQQKWVFFAMGVMAGIIFILAAALLGQYQGNRAYAQQESITPEEGRNLWMAVGGSADNRRDIVWVLHEHPPLQALAGLMGDSEESRKLRKEKRVSLMMYRADNGNSLKLIAVRDLAYDEELMEYGKPEDPSVRKVYEDLKRAVRKP